MGEVDAVEADAYARKERVNKENNNAPNSKKSRRR